MELLDRCMESSPNESVWIDADKQGARDRYAAMLQNHFSTQDFTPWIDILHESHESSLYSWSNDRSDSESSVATTARRWLRFRMKGERSLPTAAASCIAKYVRELAMQSWNDYWCHKMENLRPTAGYSVDAGRFLKQIQPLLLKHAVSDNEIVRRK